MATLAEQMRDALDRRGDHPKLANLASGWFAITPAKWKRLVARAKSEGRDGPVLIVYRTKTGDPFDHYVIPYAVTAGLLTDATAPVRKNGKPARWELMLKNGRLRVTHGSEPIDVAKYHQLALPGEDISNSVLRTALLSAPTSDADELERRTRILRAKPMAKPAGSERPRRVKINGQTAYERRADVKAWVQREAAGRCELCGSDAPFVDDTGEPFLEVHHVQQLAEDGPDVVENTVALCPNCHRRLHHAADRAALRARLYEKVGRLRLPGSA